MIIAVINQKGGVGKTTTAVNLAAALAERGRRVLLVDLDSQANASALLGVREVARSVFDALVDAEKVSLRDVIRVSSGRRPDGEEAHLGTAIALAPGHRALAGLESALRDEPGHEMLLKEALEPVRDDYDFVLFDNGPTLGLSSVMSLVAADLALVPLQCERLAVEGLSQAYRTIDLTRRRMNPHLQRRVVLTMVDQRFADGKQIADEVRAALGEEVLQTSVRTSSKLKMQSTIFDLEPKGLAAADYRALAAEIEDMAAQNRTKDKSADA